MRVVHSNKANRPDITGLSRDQAFKLGLHEERNNNAETAIYIYKTLLRQHHTYDPAYTRLMILYRKAKDYKSEIEIIDKAIAMTLASYIKTSRLKINPRITRLSSLLAKSTGLTDKKGKPVHEPEIVTKWKKRRAIAVEREKKAKAG